MSRGSLARSRSVEKCAKPAFNPNFLSQPSQLCMG